MAQNLTLRPHLAASPPRSILRPTTRTDREGLILPKMRSSLASSRPKRTPEDMVVRLAAGPRMNFMAVAHQAHTELEAAAAVIHHQPTDSHQEVMEAHFLARAMISNSFLLDLTKRKKGCWGRLWVVESTVPALRGTHSKVMDTLSRDSTADIPHSSPCTHNNSHLRSMGWVWVVQPHLALEAGYSAV